MPHVAGPSGQIEPLQRHAAGVEQGDLDGVAWLEKTAKLTPSPVTSLQRPGQSASMRSIYTAR